MDRHQSEPDRPVDAAEELEKTSTEKQNFTERHPEHFRRPPGHVRELREGESGAEESGPEED